MKPYYQDDHVTIYHGDCREVMDEHRMMGDMVLTDPPYGIGWDTEYAARGMGRHAQSGDYAAVHDDAEPFDPRFLLRKAPKVVLFGANHYANLLPASAGWIVWDKTGGGRNVSDLSDAELAWTNVTGGVRTFSHMWKGMLKDSERDQRRVHPTQKPVALMAWIVGRWTEPGDLILDPYMGSGPVARAARDLGRRYVGIEIVEDYCAEAVGRLDQQVLAL